jgi:hypothetical protein
MISACFAPTRLRVTSLILYATSSCLARKNPGSKKEETGLGRRKKAGLDAIFFVFPS